MQHDHRQVMVDLAIQNGWRRGIELGLGSGQLFARLLHQGVTMIGVDMGARPDRKAKIEALQADPDLSQHIAAIYWATTSQAAPMIPDGWADFIFIDAGHSYEAVRDDIANYLPKVKPGGWFGGHDFHPSWPGVQQAVIEKFGAVELLDGYIWARLPQ